MAEKDENYRAPLLWLVIPYTCGLAASGHLPDTAAGLLAGLGVLLAAGAFFSSRVACRSHAIAWASCIVAAAFLSGALRMQSVVENPRRWMELPPREVTLDLEITRVFPPSGKKATASALAKVLHAPPLVADLAGTRVYVAQVVLPGGADVLRSQRIRVAGVIESLFLDPETIGRRVIVPGNDSFREYLISNAVLFRLTRCRVVSELGGPTPRQQWSTALGARFARILTAGLPPNNPATHSHLAMFLGRKDVLSDEQKENYMHTGAMHLFAISGLHIAAIAGCMHGLLRVIRLPELVRAAVGILALIAFVEATGGTPSARRAFLMVALVWVGSSLRRPSNPIASIATAAFAVLVLDPLAFRSISFQFSYAVVAMLLLYAAPLSNRLLAGWHPWAHIPDAEWRWWHRGIFFGGRKLIIITCTSWTAALISTPITIAYFGLASPGAVIANLVLVPVAFFSIMAAFCSLLCGLCGATWISVIFNHASVMILTGMNGFAAMAADWPGMYFEGRFVSAWNAPVVVTSLLVLCLVGYGVRWSRVPGGLLLPPAVLVLLLVLLVTPVSTAKDSGAMKSAYELAMERLQRSAPDAGKPLTQEQKERLGEIDRVYQGKIAEREIFLKQRMVEAQGRGELEEAAKISQQIASERVRLEEDRESEKEQVRRAASSTG